MIYKFVLAYDRVDDDDPLYDVILAILNAEPIDLKPILHTTIEFTLEIDGGKNEVIWIMNQILTEIGSAAYSKIYQCNLILGIGKLYNPAISSQEDNRYIGSAFKEKKLAALNNVKSFRGLYSSSN